MGKQTILTLIRYILVAAGAYFAAKGVGDEQIWQEITGAATVLTGSIWSIFEERRHALNEQAEKQ